MDRTKALILQAQQGNQQAKSVLLEENSGLIWSIVRRFSNKGHDLEDIYQIGAIGLLKCIEKFDFSYDVKFSTYAVPMILGEIRRFFRDDGMLKVSRPLKEIAIKANQCKEQMTKEKGREITIQELAEALHMTIEELIPALESTKEVESLSEVLYTNENGNNITLSDTLGVCEEETIVDRLLLQEMLNTLSAKERQIIYLHYFGDKTQTEIAKQLHISQVQVSRIEKKVLAQMKTKLYGFYKK